ncbi:MAG TPA: LacI family DNA-binding transcriptional regulator [Candidatus Limnocylindrales bacterium]|nr:LacI family DNA-binding transcriptional regulator [Candidatus Limnocylindrales bacterium]
MDGPRGNGRGVTLDAVARAAGVSRATVSRVVNGNPKVGEDARRQVERAIDRLGYIPNLAARSLVTRRSGSIAVVIGEPTGRLFDDPFFPRLLRGIGAALSAHDLQLVLLMPQSAAEEARAERYLAAGHADGVLLVSLHGNDPLPGSLITRGIPVVVGGRPPEGAHASYVDVDNVQGARSAVEHLARLGRRRIATITGPVDMSAGVDRLAGYRDALAAAGIATEPALVASGDFTQPGGSEAMRRLLAARPDLDAVFAASDLMAAGAIQVLRAAGRRIPDDVAVVGYDDSPIATSIEPPLTSVRQPIEEMGREMVRLLLDRASQPESIARKVILATELVIRRSSEGVATG